MPPADQNTPTPPPAGESTPELSKPEKLGFFAKLFGKKPKEEAVPAGHESLAPPADLGEPLAPDVPGPFGAPADVPPTTPIVTSEASVAAEMPSMPESNPSDEEEGTPPVLDVPPSVGTETPQGDVGMAVPPVPDTAPSEESAEEPKDPFAPKL